MRLVVFILSLFIISGCETFEKKTPLNKYSQNISIQDSENYSLNFKEVEKLYKARCASCHGLRGDVEALGHSDTIAGEDHETIIMKLRAYKEGSLNQYGLGDVMHDIALNLTDEDIKDLAYYIENL